MHFGFSCRGLLRYLAGFCSIAVILFQCRVMSVRLSNCLIIDSLLYHIMEKTLHTRPCGIQFGEQTKGYIRQCSVRIMLSQQHHPVSHSILFIYL